MIKLLDRRSKAVIYKPESPHAADSVGSILAEAVEKGIDLEFVNLKGDDLRDFEFDCGKFFRATFREAVLHDAHFARADLTRAIFDDAKLEDTRFGRAILRYASFKRVDGADVIFEAADLYQATFEDAVLPSADFSFANLHDVNFKHADLEDASFLCACLRNADFTGADLEEVDFHHADLRYAKIEKVGIPPLASHQFISELLRRKAQTNEQWTLAARIRSETGRCWSDFGRIAYRLGLFEWAKKILSKYDQYDESIDEAEEEHGNES